VPVVRVGLVDGLESAVFTATGPIVFQPDGPGGPSVRVDGGRPWRVGLQGGRPADLRSWVAVERVAPPEAARVAAALSVWRSRGWKDARAFDMGALFGFSGEVMDTRHARIVVAGSTIRADTRAAADRIERDYGLRPSLHRAFDRLPGGTIEVEGGPDGLAIGNPVALRVAPGRADVRFTLRRVRRAKPLPTGETDPGGRTYRGALYFAIDREGRLAVGNEVGAEELLAGLVPAELYPSAPDDALRAQAVTARNEVLAKVGTRHLADPYLLCDDVHCQVYPGAAGETSRTTAAVEATRGETLFLDGRLVDAVYSASCGGSAEDNDAVWHTPPDRALRHRMDLRGAPAGGDLTTRTGLSRFLEAGVQDAFCRRTSMGHKHFRWDRRLSRTELTRLAALHEPIGAVDDLRVLARAPGGRATELELVGDAGRLTVRGELAIRRLLGGLKSALFVIEPDRDASGRLDSVRFVGGGYGHGVGMCQTGAIGRAEAGQGYREILRHYYGGAVVRRIY